MDIMKAKLICYTFGKIDHQTRSKFKREFLGYEDKSNSGKYTYRRRGILSSIPHSKPIRSVVIVENKHSKKVIEMLKKFQAQTKVYDVIIDDEELIIPQGATP